MTTKIEVEKLWRNDITGLRALAVLPILIYHAFPQLIPGGFFGVDVFFVISGFLISSIIFRNIQNGTFSYLSFYDKRIKRIIPNLLLLLTFVMLVGYFLLFSPDYNNLGRHVYSSAGFIENFRLLSEVDYFTEDALRKPLLHLWSLAIEEQFYIFFPLLSVFLWRVKPSVKLMGFFIIAVITLSFTMCLVIHDKSYAFYFPLTRFWELGGGIFLAYLESFHIVDTKRIAKSLRDSLSFIGFTLIIFSLCGYKSEWSHPGLFTVIPVLGSVLLILAKPDALINRTVLSWRAMTYVGLISYSLYLWHWPILVYLNISYSNPPFYYLLLALLVAFIWASLIYYYVENPMRLSKRIWKVPTSIVLLVALVLVASVGMMLRETKGLPGREINQEFSQIRDVRKGVDWSREPHITIGLSKIYGRNIGQLPEVLFVGDSHTVPYYHRMNLLSQKTGRTAGLLQGSGCFVLSDGKSEVCSNAFKTFYTLLKDPRIKTVVLANKWGARYDQPYFKQGIDNLKRALSERSDLTLYILLDPPWDEGVGGAQGNFDPLKHFYRFNSKYEDFEVPYPNDDRWLLGNIAVNKALNSVAIAINIEHYVCENQKCNVLKWYMDDDHLQPKSVEKYGVWVDQIFNKQI